MSSRWHTLCLAGLFVGCATLLGVGCSDDSSKKVGSGSSEGGEAGEAAGGAAPAAGGTVSAGGEGPTTSEAGQGGAPVDGAAGAPAMSAGAGGEPDLGAAGSGPLACEATGDVSDVELQAERQQTVCRGALVTTGFIASSADSTFTCCGVSILPTPYTVELAAAMGVDGGGRIGFQVPEDAPGGPQSIAVTCSSGEATNTFDILVSNAVLPVIETITPPPLSSTLLTLGGSGLADVTTIIATSVDDSGVKLECAIESQQDDNIDCYFDGGIDPGDYTLFVQATDCGVLPQPPTFTVPAPPASQ